MLPFRDGLAADRENFLDFLFDWWRRGNFSLMYCSDLDSDVAISWLGEQWRGKFPSFPPSFSLFYWRRRGNLPHSLSFLCFYWSWRGIFPLYCCFHHDSDGLDVVYAAHFRLLWRWLVYESPVFPLLWNCTGIAPDRHWNVTGVSLALKPHRYSRPGLKKTKMNLKLLWNCSETALELLWNRSEIALKLHR